MTDISRQPKGQPTGGQFAERIFADADATLSLVPDASGGWMPGDDVEAVDGDVRVVLTHIGEGWSGDYDADDPDDQPLYRLDVFLRNTVPLALGADGDSDDTWVVPQDSSLCTQLPTSTPKETLDAFTADIARQVSNAVKSGRPGQAEMLLRRLVEDASSYSADELLADVPAPVRQYLDTATTDTSATFFSGTARAVIRDIVLDRGPDGKPLQANITATRSRRTEVVTIRTRSTNDDPWVLELSEINGDAGPSDDVAGDATRLAQRGINDLITAMRA